MKSCSARTGEGIWEAFECFMSQIHQLKSGRCDPAGFIHTSDQDDTQTSDSLLDLKFAFTDPFNFLKSLLLY